MQVRLTTDTDLRKRNANRKKDSAAAAPPAMQKTPFLEILDEVLPAETPQNDELHGLWSSLPDAEKRLLEQPSEFNLKTYRDTVRSIARLTLKQNMRVKKIQRRTRQGEMVELNTVEILDDRLQKMALMMQSKNNSAFSLMARLDEIRGLLIDLRDASV